MSRVKTAANLQPEDLDDRCEECDGTGLVLGEAMGAKGSMPSFVDCPSCGGHPPDDPVGLCCEHEGCFEEPLPPKGLCLRHLMLHERPRRGAS